jgi:beta-galactosidase
MEKIGMKQASIFAEGSLFRRATDCPHRLIRFLLYVVTLAPFVALSAASAENVDLSQGWRFHRGDLAASAAAPAFDDSTWRTVVVPHDFSIEDTADGKAPFDATTPGAADSGYLRGGVGWYRRNVELDQNAVSARVILRFEAIYMNADIWINGTKAATHYYGYTAFDVEATGKMRIGKNVIAVRVNHQDPSSRWYAGSGLIRPVHLLFLNAAHIDPLGPTIRTPVATADRGVVAVRTLLINSSRRLTDGTLSSRVRNSQGVIVAEQETKVTLLPGTKRRIEQQVGVANPALWSPDAPSLYQLEQELRIDGKSADVRSTSFGVRRITIDAVHGLRINGKQTLLRGGNVHHDNYMLGAAGFARADARKIELMKAAGYNAIRSSHNPASQATLEAADRLGMLVINEAFDAWGTAKRAEDYARVFKTDWRSDIASMVRSAQNHPSVVMWSIGNEIPEQGTPAGIARARMLRTYLRTLDVDRPVTQAINTDGIKAARQFAELDVAGYNYAWQRYATDHKTHPHRVMYASESFADQAYDNWQPTKTMPWVIGDFVWTAIDYLGEAGIGWTGYSGDYLKLGPYPWHLAYCGEIDATGRALPGSYYRAIVWGVAKHPVTAFVRWPESKGSLPNKDYFGSKGNLQWVMPDLHESWSWAGYEGKPLDVVVYSELEEVELTLNGRSIGRRRLVSKDKHRTIFIVPYEAGALIAIGYQDGNPVSKWTLETAGLPVSVRLSADRSTMTADGSDLIYVTAELVDEKGRPTYSPREDRLLSFAVSGTGVLAGVGNGNPTAAESFQSPRRSSFRGRAVAVIRSVTKSGRIELKVSGPGIAEQMIAVQSEPPPLR